MTVHLTASASPARSEARPRQLVLEFVRARSGDDPYGFGFGLQDYSVRGPDGCYGTATLDWNERLLSDLDVLAVEDNDELKQRLGNQICRFLQVSPWREMAAVIVEATRRNETVHLTIRSAAAELYLLPWELLTIKSTGQHVGELANVLIRYSWPEVSTAGLSAAPTRLLLAWSSAGGRVPFAQHERQLAQACAESVKLDTLSDCSLSRLSDALARAQAEAYPISGLHLLCHGMKRGGRFRLAFSSTGSDAAYISAAQLRRLLAPYACELSLVTLCACSSSDDSVPGNHLGSMAQALHRVGIPWVVGSRYPLSVRGSVAFTELFYRHLLADGGGVPEAFRTAQACLSTLDDVDRRAWMSIQLYTCGEKQIPEKRKTTRSHDLLGTGRSRSQKDRASETAGDPRLTLLASNLSRFLEPDVRQTSLVTIDLAAEIEGKGIRLDVNCLLRAIRLDSDVHGERVTYYAATTGGCLEVEPANNATIIDCTGPDSVSEVSEHARMTPLVVKPDAEAEDEFRYKEGDPRLTSGILREVYALNVEREMGFIRWDFTHTRGNKFVQDFMSGNLVFFALLRWPDGRKRKGVVRLRPEGMRFYGSQRRPLSKLKSWLMLRRLEKSGYQIHTKAGVISSFELCDH